MIHASLTLAQNSSGGDMAGMIGMVIWFAIIGLFIAGWWKLFVKAGQPGWAAIVPIYNLYMWTKIVGRPVWFLLLCFIPFLNIIALGVLCWDLARSFGKGMGYTLGLFFLSPVFACMLGFGSAQYQGPAAAGGNNLAPAM